MPTFGELFAGIGGLSLGLERAGWRCRWQVENDPFCTAVLERHWPDITRYGDIRQVDWRSVDPVDLVAGGFPCQPVSGAGKKSAQADERWLWPEFARAIRCLRPRHVLVENVVGLFARGFGDVLGDLATLGYDAEWDCLPAEAVGAPHRRVRVFIHAWRTADPERGELRDEPGGRGWQGSEGLVPERQGASVARNDGATQPVAHADGQRRQEQQRSEPVLPDQAWLAGPQRGGWWSVEPDVGRVVDGSTSRLDARVPRLRALGNAVVPQVAEWVGHRLMEAHGS